MFDTDACETGLYQTASSHPFDSQRLIGDRGSFLSDGFDEVAYVLEPQFKWMQADLKAVDRSRTP